MSIRTIENDYLKVQVADDGAELCSVYDKKRQQEVIWQADPAYWKRHAPILFPNVGKHYGGGYRHEGQFYPTGQHGFARDRRFICTREEPLSITHILEADEATRAVFPFEFVLEVTHTLEEKRIRVSWQVKNVGDNTMYFTIGGHPAFRVPVLEGTEQTEYKLLFDEKECLEYVLLDPGSGTAVAEAKQRLELENSSCAIDAHMFDQDALVFDGGQIEWAAIAYPDGSPYVGIDCAGFTNFGIWSVPGAPYVCLEPWQGRCDDQGFSGEISEKPGITALNPTEIFQKSYEIIIY